MATGAIVPDLNTFNDHLETIAGKVHPLLCEGDWPLPISTMLERRLSGDTPSLKTLRAFFFDFAMRLLTLAGGPALRQQPGFIRWCAAQQKSDHAESDPLADKYYVEYLAATGLALYFLGEPFSQPWERVRKWVAKDGGGLPNGVCVGKAIGDIIRGARLAHKRPAFALGRNREEIEPAELRVMLLSHLPIVLFESLLKDAENLPDCVPPAAHELGRCYELLQLRLYANEGLPMKYLVDKEAVRPRLSKQSDPAAAWSAMIKWLCETVFTANFSNQAVCLVSVKNLPAVFLNHNTGLYTFASKQQQENSAIEMPFPASYMQEARRKLYQKALGSIAVTDEENLLISGRANGALVARKDLLGF